MKKLAFLFIISLLFPISNALSETGYKYKKDVILQKNNREKLTSLGGDYAKDNWSVYYRGKKIEDASASSFKYLEDGYAKDNWNLFYRGKKTKD